MEEIRKSVSINNADQLIATVHRMHGSSAVCGVPALNDVVQRLEEALNKQQDELVADLLIQLEDTVESLLTFSCKESRSD